VPIRVNANIAYAKKRFAFEQGVFVWREN